MSFAVVTIRVIELPFDPTFGEDGTVKYSGLGTAVAIQPDGKIVVTGGTYNVEIMMC